MTRTFRIVLLLGSLVVLFGCAESPDRSGEANRPQTDATPRSEETTRKPETPPGSETTTRDERRKEVEIKLQNRLEAAVGSSSGRVAVSVEGLSGAYAGVRASMNGDEVFQSASMIKVLILAELLREVDRGEVSLQESLGGSTVEALAYDMISVSDNDATNLLIDRIGFDKVNALASELGLTETVLQRKMLDFGSIAQGRDNYTSSSDMAVLFGALWGRDLLSPESRRFALSALGDQRLNSKLPVGLPAGTKMLHKTGELEGIEHDGGIVVTPDGAYTLVVLTEGDPTSNIEMMRRISGLTYGSMSET